MMFYPASNLSLAKSAWFSYDLLQQHPPRLSTMRTRGVTISGPAFFASPLNTPAMPHHDAHSGGFFLPRISRLQQLNPYLQISHLHRGFPPNWDMEAFWKAAMDGARLEKAE